MSAPPVSLWRYSFWIKPVAPLLVLSSVAMVISSAGALALPWFGKTILDAVSKSGDPSELDQKMFALLALWTFASVAGYCEQILTAQAGLSIVANIRRTFFSRLLHLPISFFDHAKTGDLVARFSSDIDLVQETLTSDLIRVGGHVAKVIGGLVLLFVLDWRLTLGFGVLVLLLPVTYRVLGPRLRGTTRRALEASAELLSAFTETIGHVRTVKTFAREPYEEARLSERLDRALAYSIKSSRFEGLIWTAMSASFTTVLIGILWYGGREILSGSVTLGTVLAYLMTVSIVATPLVSLAGLYTRLTRTRAASERIFAVLDAPQDPPDAPDAKALLVGRGEVELEGLRFAYKDEQWVVNGFDLRLPAGKTTALVGPSGSGKSTVTSLLYRLYELDAGRIVIDGQPIDRVTRRSLREQIALVPQEPHLFDGSIRDNIAYGREGATPEDVQRAAEQAHVTEFSSKLEQGLDTQIGERGVRLSGGQRQRIAIARALLKDAKILILDEATSQLDPESEALVRKAIDRLVQDRTTLVIAHRLATIQNADQIAVLSEGRVAAIGPHVELLEKSRLYSRLYDLVRMQSEEAPAR